MAFAAIGLLVVAGVAIKMFWWPAIIDPPALDLAKVDPAVRRLIEERLSEVRKTPRSADAWGTLAIVLDNNLFEQALPCFAQAERLDPTNPRWPHYQGITLLRSDPGAALPRFQRATQLAGDAASPSRLRLAELYLQLGRFEEARAEFETLLKADAKLPWAHLGLARLAFHEGKPDQSRRHLLVPLSVPMTAKSALLLSAEINAREGNAAAARQDLAKAMDLQRAPDWPDPFVRDALQYQAGQAALVRKAEMLCDMRRLPEATKLLQEVVREYPESKAGWTLMGWALMQQGRPGDAEKCLHAALKIDADVATPLVYLGMIRATSKDSAGAKDYFRRAIDKKPDSFEAHFNLGQCLKEEKDLPGAIAELRKAVDCQPFNARAHAQLGELLLDNHREDDASFHLQEAITLNPNLKDAKKRLEDLKEKQAGAKKSP
jgi:tetratricopeptide (TPR) repeat protein